jgi:hypothetical protein
LAHAWHDLALDENRQITEAYQEAKRSRKYENVEQIWGGFADADALTSESEYFAELSEAYFW